MTDTMYRLVINGVLLLVVLYGTSIEAVSDRGVYASQFTGMILGNMGICMHQ